MRGVSYLGCIAAADRPCAAAHDATFLGFRLLDLENQTVKWQSPHMGVGAALTYAFATEAVDTPGARNCAKLEPPEKAYVPSHITADQFRHEVAEAFRMWEGVANLTFRETLTPRALTSSSARRASRGPRLHQRHPDASGRAGPEDDRALAHLPQPAPALEDRLRRPARRVRPALHHRARDRARHRARSPERGGRAHVLPLRRAPEGPAAGRHPGRRAALRTAAGHVALRRHRDRIDPRAQRAAGEQTRPVVRHRRSRARILPPAR